MIRNDAAATLNLRDQSLAFVKCIQQLPRGLIKDVTFGATLTFQSRNHLAQLVEAVAYALTALLLWV